MKINEILNELRSVDASGKRVRIKDIIGKPEPVQTVEPDDYEDYSDEVDVNEPELDIEPEVKPKQDSMPDPIDTEAEKANASIKNKVDYLVKQGVLQSGRITDTEKQYIDSVDVYVDPNKFAKADPSEVILKATSPGS